MNLGAVVGVPSQRFGASVIVNTRAVIGALLDVTQNDLDGIIKVIDGFNNNNLSGIVDCNGDITRPTDEPTSANKSDTAGTRSVSTASPHIASP